MIFKLVEYYGKKRLNFMIQEHKKVKLVSFKLRKNAFLVGEHEETKEKRWEKQDLYIEEDEKRTKNEILA